MTFREVERIMGRRQCTQTCNGMGTAFYVGYRTIHLVITDVVMPGLSGHELVQQLVPARPRIKVLYLSGYAPDAFATPLAAEALKTFLQKPFTLQNLSRKVREVLGTVAG